MMSCMPREHPRLVTITMTPPKALFYSKLFLGSLEVWKGPAAVLKEKVKPGSSTDYEGCEAEG